MPPLGTGSGWGTGGEIPGKIAVIKITEIRPIA